ncbi:MAG: formylglycine-generating enzyme family protein [Isosphaeraceae bacterium]
MATPAGMVWIPAGTFLMGDESFADAQPVHEVQLDGFWLDETEVTNAQFARFVDQTGYVTVAELPPDPRDFPPDVPRDKLVPGSIVYKKPNGPVSLNDPLSWWEYVPGANWKHPEGPGSSIEGKADHPVVHVCWEDAAEYARWAGKRLPTEAEFEYAWRGGKVGARYSWGNELRPQGKCMANTWQGEFPSQNLAEDGYTTTSPVKSFPPNGYGLYDMAGNVWEWCEDWYRPDTYARSPRRNPRGPGDSDDPDEPGISKRVQRGGSFQCAENYCTRYLVASRGKGEPKSAAWHIGFRCARSAP